MSVQRFMAIHAIAVDIFQSIFQSKWSDRYRYPLCHARAWLESDFITLSRHVWFWIYIPSFWYFCCPLYTRWLKFCLYALKCRKVTQICLSRNNVSVSQDKPQISQSTVFFGTTFWRMNMPNENSWQCVLWFSRITGTLFQEREVAAECFFCDH